MKLNLIRRGDAELICDEEGRPLENVRDFEYVSPLNGEAILTIRVTIPRPEWQPSLSRDSEPKSPERFL